MLAKFQVYQLSLEFYRECQKVETPRHIKDQLSRSSLSICLNLAEGSGKPTWRDKRRFYSISLGSCRETQALLEIIGAQPELVALLDRIAGCLYRLIHPRQ